MRTLILIAANVLIVGAACAAEETPETREEVEGTFESLDRNDDERISKDEARREASLRERFAGVDASGDGYLSKSEFHARPSDEPFE